MAQEIELKLAVSDDDVAPLLAWLDRHGEAAGEATLLNIYLDTPAHDLAHMKAALRLRRKGGSWLQTLKTAGSSDGGLAVRQEWETGVAGEAIEPAQLPAEAQQWLAPLVGHLAPVFRTDFLRRTWRLKVDGGGEIEAAFDVGLVKVTDSTGATLTETIQELELEWLAGDTAQAPAALLALGRTLGGVTNLTPSDLSKAARGYRLAAMAGATGQAGD